MELVYLWIEDYKNIHKQGFNFSGRYRCHYDPDQNELTIDENKEYVHIFPPNINVTAIVGKNGSGKSSILEILNHILFEQDIRHKICIKSIIFFKKGNIIYSAVGGLTNEHEKKHVEALNIISPNLALDHHDSPYAISNEIKSYFFNFFMPLTFGHKYKSYHNKYSQGQNGIMTGHDEAFYRELPPYQYVLSSLIVKFKFLYSVDKHYFSFMGENFLFDSIDVKLKNISNIKDKYTDLVDYYPSGLYEEHQKRIDFFNSFKQEILGNLKNEMSFRLFNLSDVDYHTLLIILEYAIEEKSNVFINLVSSKGKASFIDLSSGEQNLLKFFIELFYTLEWSKNQNILLMIDEVETSLHPDWQCKIINYINKGLLGFTNPIQVLITSHSPFILSDIPKENVIFLKDGKQDETVNIDTFGANIHTLLSHGFFMKDGLMGEFAKEKINEVIKLLKRKGKISQKNLKQCEEIISIIGEPILQKTLQTMLDEKKSSHLTKLEKLKIQQKEIEDQIKSLEEDQ